MLRNVSQADASAEAFISSSLDIRKMMLSKYPPLHFTTGSCQPARWWSDGCEMYWGRARLCTSGGKEWGNLSSELKMIRLLKAGATVGVCLQQPRRVSTGWKWWEKSLEINNFPPSARFEGCASCWQRQSQSEFLRLTLDLIIEFSCLRTYFEVQQSWSLEPPSLFLFHSQA